MDAKNSFIYIIESPSEADNQAGRNEASALQRFFDLGGIPCYLLKVRDRNELKTSLGAIEWALEHLPHDPIIHFSGHGNENGIQLTDGTNISWKELRGLLQSVAEKKQSKLLLCFSSCEGSNGFKMCCDFKSPVFEDLVGPKTTVKWADSAIAYVTFYHSFLSKGCTLKEAVRRMNVAAGFPELTPVFDSACGSAIRTTFIKGFVTQMVVTLRALQQQGQ